MIGIDTITWGKIFDLCSTRWKPLIEEFISKMDVFITHEVQKELLCRYRSENEEYPALLEATKILPVLNKSIHGYLERGFDIADASLLEYSEIKEITIITEDNGMLLEGITDRNNIIQFIDLLMKLYSMDLITNREIYHLMKYLKQNRNITKKKVKKVLNEIQT